MGAIYTVALCRRFKRHNYVKPRSYVARWFHLDRTRVAYNQHRAKLGCMVANAGAVLRCGRYQYDFYFARWNYLDFANRADRRHWKFPPYYLGWRDVEQVRCVRWE